MADSDKDTIPWSMHVDPTKTALPLANPKRVGPGNFSKEVAQWGDPAMWTAEPIDGATVEHGATPRVYLLQMTPDPLGEIAAVSHIYRGRAVRSLSEITEDDRSLYFRDVAKSRIRAPFEFVKFHFLLEGVSRGFTHQMVRQRTAVYGQESLRFAVKDNLASEMVIPPSLAGLKDDDPKRVVWDKAVEEIHERYMALINAGVPAEDARGLLPTNVATRIHYSTDLNSLMAHSGNRLCTMAQFEWRIVWAGIMKAIRDASYDGSETRWDGGIPLPEDCNGRDHVWRAKDLLQLFKPICYQTGKCEFLSEFDRYCSIRERVQANHANGIPSDEWGTHHVDMKSLTHSQIEPIRTEEWLVDTRAAHAHE